MLEHVSTSSRTCKYIFWLSSFWGEFLLQAPCYFSLLWVSLTYAELSSFCGEFLFKLCAVSICGEFLLHIPCLILILMWYIAGPNFRYKCDGRRVRTCKSDGALDGEPSLEVLKCGGPSLGHHWCGSNWWWCGQKKRVLVLFTYLSEGLRRV